jgi:hypothetical protein
MQLEKGSFIVKSIRSVLGESQAQAQAFNLFQTQCSQYGVIWVLKAQGAATPALSDLLINTLYTSSWVCS